MQLHAFAASDDPEIRDFVRQRVHPASIALVSRRVPGHSEATDLRHFFAQGMLLNVAAAAIAARRRPRRGRLGTPCCDGAGTAGGAA